MILQALYDLAHQEGLMVDPDFEWKPIAWILTVSEDGSLLVLTHTASTSNMGGESTRLRPRSFLVPREAGRTRGDRAFLLFDKAEYVLGLDPEPTADKRRDPERLAARRDLFRLRAEQCFEASGDEGVGAVCRFLARLKEGEITPLLPPECASHDLFGFVYAPDRDRLVTSRPKVRDYWRSLRALPEDGGANRRICLVSGALAPRSPTVPLIKNVPGGTASGVALVSFNGNAFESYGWAGNDNAHISREAAEACSTALNRLLHPAFPDPSRPDRTLPPRHLRLSADTAVCFWSASPSSSDAAGLVQGLMEANVEAVVEKYRPLWQGIEVEIADPSALCVLTLSGFQGRLILRDWLVAPVREVARNLARHFADLAIVRGTPPLEGAPPVPALRGLLRSLAARGDDRDIPAALAGHIVRAALTGSPYPISILQRALERSRAERSGSGRVDREHRDRRAALIRAVLNRRRRSPRGTPSFPEVSPALDPHNHQPAYLMGRLLALLAGWNATVGDRFFRAALAAPHVVFPRLLRKFRHPVRGPEENLRGRWIELQVDQIVLALEDRGASFPATLSLEDQGLFLLGHHHQSYEKSLLKSPRPEREPQEKITDDRRDREPRGLPPL